MAIPTNQILHRFGMVDSPNCVFCNKNPETLVHLFVNCEELKTFWNTFQLFINDKLNPNIVLNTTTILFGFSDNILHVLALNCLLLCAKFSIYKSKFNATVPTFSLFFSDAKVIINSEKIIAEKSNSLPAHLNKWEDFL